MGCGGERKVQQQPDTWQMQGWVSHVNKLAHKKQTGSLCTGITTLIHRLTQLTKKNKNNNKKNSHKTPIFFPPHFSPAPANPSHNKLAFFLWPEPRGISMAALALQGAKCESSEWLFWRNLEPPPSLLQQLPFLLFVSASWQWVSGSWQENLPNNKAASGEHHLWLREITLLVTLLRLINSSRNIYFVLTALLFTQKDPAVLLCLIFKTYNLIVILIPVSYFKGKSIMIF